MDSTVALYWLMNPGNNWKVFVSNRVQKIATVTKKFNIFWKYCSTDKNISGLGSRGASVDKMEKGDWFTGHEWFSRNQTSQRTMGEKSTEKDSARYRDTRVEIGRR